MSASPKIVAQPARILIADDERPNRQVLELMLASEGFLVLNASSGEEALTIVAHERPDLVLLDVMMPGMDGYQVAAKIKSNVATKNIPVIMVTALDDRHARMRGLGAGAEDFLSKPVDRAELCVRVRNLLRLKAYGDYQDKYSQILEAEVRARTADLTDSENLYRSTFDEAPVGIVHVGLDGKWLRVNKRFCGLLGYSSEELQSAVIQTLVQPAAVSGETESLLRLAAGMTDRNVVDQKRYRRRDGSFVWARVSTSVHRDAAAKALHFISVVEDVTEHRMLEEERKKSEVALKQANRDLEAFSYSVAHDLRAPLRGMGGFAQLLLDTYGDKLDAEGQDWLHEIGLNARRMAALIDALLSLARITRVDLKPESIDLTAVVRAAATALAAAEPNRAVHVVIQDDLRAHIDPQLARALIDNLLGNAWKFTRKSPSPRIEVAAIQSNDDSTFFVRDNGAGFDMAFADKLFSPFQRLHTAADFPGTGIGLATAQRIVQRHGGRIWSEGSVNRGATFYVTLPRHPQKERSDEKSHSADRRQ